MSDRVSKIEKSRKNNTYVEQIKSWDTYSNASIFLLQLPIISATHLQQYIFWANIRIKNFVINIPMALQFYLSGIKKITKKLKISLLIIN